MRTDFLLDLLKEFEDVLYPLTTVTQLVQTLDNPDWEDKREVHNWKNYVPSYAKRNWTRLSLETRALVFCMTSKLAHNEDWD